MIMRRSIRGAFAALALVVGIVGSYAMRSDAADSAPPAVPPSYALSDYAPYAGPGTIRLRSRFIVQNLGSFGTTSVGGVEIIALPDLPYSKWHVLRTAYCFANKGACDWKTLLAYPPELRKFTLVTTADKDGYYTFTGLHAGRYIFHASVETMTTSSHVQNGMQSIVTPGGELAIVPQAQVVNDGEDREFEVATEATIGEQSQTTNVPYFVVLGSLWMG